MSHVTFLDSSGIGTLQMLCEEVKAYGGEIFLLNVNETQMKLLKLSRLDRLFSFERSKPY